MIDTLLFGWGKNLDYGPKLVADLSAEQMVYQPAAGMNHPAWVLSHLNAYHPVIAAMIRGEKFKDPILHKYGMRSEPVADVAEYPGKDELVAEFVRGHEEVESALCMAGEAVLSTDVVLTRWKKAMPSVGAALGYLMLVHEATHLGQLSAWRRVQGMASV